MNLNAASVYPVTGSLSAAGGLDEIQTIASRASNGEKMSEEELQKVGQKCEALLLHNLVCTMRDSLPENPLFSESEGEKMYWDMFDESMSEAAASGQSTGITQAIVEELKRQQEQVTPPKGENPFRSLAPAPIDLEPIQPREELTPLPNDQTEFEPIKEHLKIFRPIPGRGIATQ